ncbi:MAG: YicC/YloC family endoribonuclease [Pseudomonadota bacterium]
MTRSMTGFASREGSFGPWSWSWDVRSVNGRGLDVRLRLPDWIDGLEAPVRAAVQKVVARGNVTLTLRVTRDAGEDNAALSPDALRRVVSMLREIEMAAAEGGMTLAQTSAAEILAIRGVQDTATATDATDPLRTALLEDLTPLLQSFVDARAAEGEALHALIDGQVTRIAEGVTEARGVLDARSDQMRTANAAALAKVMDSVDRADPDRLAQELALIAVKTDVAEELDRLDAYVIAARELLDAGGAKGRKMDFLTQEFNREANTLCAKAQFTNLTRIGLDLKHTIDQMREQVQNVE